MPLASETCRPTGELVRRTGELVRRTGGATEEPWGGKTPSGERVRTEGGCCESPRGEWQAVATMGGGAPGVLLPTYIMLPPTRGLPMCPGTETLRRDLSLKLALPGVLEPASLFLLPLP